MSSPEEIHRHAGYLLDNQQGIALLIDSRRTDFPIVGISSGFRDLTKYTLEDVLGSNFALMIQKAPNFAVSKSAIKNLTNYFDTCRSELESISETHVEQPLTRKDGSHVGCLFCAGLCELRRHTYVLLIAVEVGEGLAPTVSAARRAELAESSRAGFRRVRRVLNVQAFKERFTSDASLASTISEPESPAWGRCRPVRQAHFSKGHRREKVLLQPAAPPPAFAFFSQRLQDHCVLTNDGYTATRREAHELQNGCLLFSDRPMIRSLSGLEFSVRVDIVGHGFCGLPLLGFTRKKPADCSGLYPRVTSCLGNSVLVGSGGKAFARDQDEHFIMGFKLPPQHEVAVWTSPKEAAQKFEVLRAGDVLKCVYTREGGIQLWKNGAKIIDFDIGRPIDCQSDYYAVVDVCLTASTVTVLPSKPSKGFRPKGIETMLSPIMSLGDLPLMSQDFLDSGGDDSDSAMSCGKVGSSSSCSTESTAEMRDSDNAFSGITASVPGSHKRARSEHLQDFREQLLKSSQSDEQAIQSSSVSPQAAPVANILAPKLSMGDRRELSPMLSLCASLGCTLACILCPFFFGVWARHRLKHV